MTDDSSGQVPFQAHVELLRLFLNHRKEIVERIESLLNASRRPTEFLQDRPLLTRHIDECFYTVTQLTEDQRLLRGQLEAAHWASGFRPRHVPGLYNDLIHPAEMMIRGFFCWAQTRWPGRDNRMRYAHTLFNLYLLRSLTLLSMSLWSTGSSRADEQLTTLQAVLDALWNSAPTDQPVLVRDVRWLIPLAQSPTTDELKPYFEVAEFVAESLSEENRIEIQIAHVRMLGGHLTSQIRHYCLQDNVSIDANSVVLRTRTSNALDFALLVQGLVPLLNAYEKAVHGGDEHRRRILAGAILQGISPDPEVFLTRVDLLGPYSMVEHLFIATDDDGRAVYTDLGQRHSRLLHDYEAQIAHLLKPLLEDSRQCKPATGTYSPFGAIFGNPSNLTEFMAMRTLTRDAVSGYSLEDVFRDDDTDAKKLAWANSWRKLPHIKPDVQKLYEYPQQFADDLFDRIERTLNDPGDTPKTGHLLVQIEGDRAVDSETAAIPDLPVRYVFSSDSQIVESQKAVGVDQAQLLRDRLEGHFVLSYETSGGWVAIRKDVLTDFPGAGRDVRIVDLPRAAAAVLRLTCPSLVSN